MAHALETFFSAWADGDADAVSRAVSDDVHYHDPRTPDPLTGPTDLAEYVAMFSQYAPGAKAEIVHLSEVGPHVRATVAFKMADGKLQHGQYFADIGTDGRVTRLIGFVGFGAPE